MHKWESTHSQPHEITQHNIVCEKIYVLFIWFVCFVLFSLTRTNTFGPVENISIWEINESVYTHAKWPKKEKKFKFIIKSLKEKKKCIMTNKNKIEKGKWMTDEYDRKPTYDEATA